MPVHITSTEVDKAIRRVVWPRLRDHGFDQRTGRTAWRRWDEGVDVVNFQSFNSYLADGAGCTTFSFAVNLGTTLDYLPKASTIDPARPREYQCAIRLHLRKRITQPFFLPYASVLSHPTEDDLVDRSDIWYVVADGSNLDEVVEDAAAVLGSDGLAWFEWARDPTALVARLQAGVAGDLLGTPTSPSMALLVGFAARRAGLRDIAHVHLLRAQEYPGFRPFAAQIETALAEVG